MIVVMGLLVTAESYAPTISRLNDLSSSSPSSEKNGNSNRLYRSLENELSLQDFNIIKRYAAEYDIDYRLILAIIKHESRFDPNALSRRGAEGFMQLMPVTNAEVVEHFDIADSLLPADNVRGGIYYFAKLFKLFQANSAEDRFCLALAAYNAGPSRIYDAQELAAYLGENPNKWQVIQNVLPLLSKRYYSLHQMVWLDGRPPNGSFGSWRQTIAYVENIRKTYREFQNIVG